MPTFADYREPEIRPAVAGYSAKDNTGSTSSLGKRRRRVSPYYFNQDIALEQINMTIIKEGPKMMEYLAESDCDTIMTATIMPVLIPP